MMPSSWLLERDLRELRAQMAAETNGEAANALYDRIWPIVGKISLTPPASFFGVAVKLRLLEDTEIGMVCGASATGMRSHCARFANTWSGRRRPRTPCAPSRPLQPRSAVNRPGALFQWDGGWLYSTKVALAPPKLWTPTPEQLLLKPELPEKVAV
jgi:hypothetical protein